MPWIAALDTAPLAERLALTPDTPVLVVLPGSRSSEVSRLMRPFGEALARLLQRGRKFEVVDAGRAVGAPADRAHLKAWPITAASHRGRGRQVSRFQAGPRGAGGSAR